VDQPAKSSSVTRSSVPATRRGTPGHPLGSDPYTDPRSQHATEVEPDALAAGDTIVAAFQVGRYRDGGSTNIGVATSTDRGVTWTALQLPGITTAEGGHFDRVSDPSVAFDAKHGVWLVTSLAISAPPGGSPAGAAVVVNRSRDGITWEPAVTVAAAPPGGFLDKNWTASDNNPNSPFFGNSYTVFDDNGSGDLVQLTTSTDGGRTWSAPQTTPDQFTGLGGEPVVQPDGTVIIPMVDGGESSVWSVVSKDGGRTWSSANPVSDVQAHDNSGGLRTGPLPSTGIDASGRVYVVWQDSRFRKGGSTNDLVMSTSDDGVSWTTPVRIPIDPVTSGVDHFIPGLGVDPATSGNSAHLALSYYYYPKGNCAAAACELRAAIITSTDGGATWSVPQDLTGPMKLAWIPQTTQGSMVGDYMATTFDAAGKAHPVFAVASAPTRGKLDVAMASPPGGLSLPVGVNPAEAAPAGMFSTPTQFQKSPDGPGDLDL
jgi:hypothetical protein